LIANILIKIKEEHTCGNRYVSCLFISSSLVALPAYPYNSVLQQTCRFCTRFAMPFFIPPLGYEAEQSLSPAAA